MDIELGRGRKEEAGVVMSEDEERWERNRRRIWMWCFMADRRFVPSRSRVSPWGGSRGIIEEELRERS
jgi:hypothetical protein